MSHFISINGRWKPCADLLGWNTSKEDWKDVAERNGFYDFSYYKAGHPEGFFVESHAMQPRRTFACNEAVTEIVVVTTLHHLEYFYCTGSLARIDILERLARISSAEHVSIELRSAERRRGAIDIEEVDDIEGADSEDKENPA